MEILLWTNGGISIKDNIMWFTPTEHNLVCQYDIKKKEIINCFVGDTFRKWEYASYTVEMFDECMVQIPTRDTYIHILDENLKMQSILVERYQTDEEKYLCVAKKNSKMYFLPYMSDSIMVLSNKKLDYISCGVKRIISSTQNNEKVLFVNYSEDLWEFDFETQEIKSILRVKGESLCWCGYINDSLYLASKERGLYIVEGTNLRLLKVQMEDDFIDYVVGNEEKLFIFFRKCSECILVKNLISGDVSKILLDRDEKFNENWVYNAFGKPVVWEKKIYVMSPSHREVFVIDTYSEVVEREAIYLKTMGTEVYKKLLKNNGNINENELFSLDEFIKNFYV